jgi:hypothetical protein
MLYLDCSCLNLPLGIFLEFLRLFEYFSCFKTFSRNFLELFSYLKYFRKKITITKEIYSEPLWPSPASYAAFDQKSVSAPRTPLLARVSPWPASQLVIAFPTPAGRNPSWPKPLTCSGPASSPWKPIRARRCSPPWARPGRPPPAILGVHAKAHLPRPLFRAMPCVACPALLHPAASRPAPLLALRRTLKPCAARSYRSAAAPLRHRRRRQNQPWTQRRRAGRSPPLPVRHRHLGWAGRLCTRDASHPLWFRPPLLVNTVGEPLLEVPYTSSSFPPLNRTPRCSNRRQGEPPALSCAYEQSLKKLLTILQLNP